MKKSLLALIICFLPLCTYAKTDGNGNVTSDKWNDRNIFNNSSNNNLGDKVDKNGLGYWAQDNVLTNSNNNNIAGWENKLNSSSGNKIDGFDNSLTNSHNNVIGDKNKCAGSQFTPGNMECTIHGLTVIDSDNNIINGSGLSVIEASDRNDFQFVNSSAKNTYDTHIYGNNMHVDTVRDSDFNGTWTNATNVNNGYTNGNYNDIFNSDGSSIRGNNNSLTGDDSHIIGNSNTVFGGDNNLVTGNSNSVAGNENVINGNNNFVHGSNLGGNPITVNDSILYGDGNAGLGDTVTDIKNSVVIGGNSGASTTGDSLTDSVSINANGTSGTNVINIGGTVNDDNTISIGAGSQASNTGIALGSGSVSNKANEVNIGDRQLTGVLDGVADSDAINVSQMTSSMETVVTDANSYTDANLNNIVNKGFNYVDNRINDSKNILSNRIMNYADSRFNDLSDRIEQNNKRMKAGIASAMAGAAIPVKPSQKLSFGLGVATYEDEFASAVGLTWQASNRTAFKGTVSFDSQSGTGVTAGLAIAF